jgi:phosphatidylserine synthase
MRAPVHDLHVSNLLTYVALMSGVAAMFAAIAARSLPLAGMALAISAIADTLDGRFARSFARSGRQSRIGRELDSLVDAATFGVAPLVIVATRFEHGWVVALGSWIAGGCYLLAAVTRLSFYTVEEDETRFVGIPTPAAALLCVTSLVVPTPPWLAAWPLLAGAVLMIAPVAVPRPRGVGLLAFASWGFALVATLAFGLGG